jgi:hypothetical protein
MRSKRRCSLCLQFALILGAGPVPETQRIAMWRLLSRVRYSVTEESRLQSILAISVVSTKNSSLQSQSHFDYDEATIR